MPIDFPFEAHTYSLWMPRVSHIFVRGHRDLKKGTWPSCRGIYFLCRSIGVTYIGKSENLFQRITQHANHAPNNAPYTHIFVIPLPDNVDIDQWEADAIELFSPQFNKQSRNYNKKYCDSVLSIPRYLQEKSYDFLEIDQPIFRIRFPGALLDM